MENLSDEIKMKMLKSIDPNELPKELLIEILKEQELENKEKQQMLIDYDAIEKCLREKVTTLQARVNELEKGVDDYWGQILELQKERDEKNLEQQYRGDPMIVVKNPVEAPDLFKLDRESDVDLEEMKKTNYTVFLQECCKWTAKQKKPYCKETKKHYAVAQESVDNIYNYFKDWALHNKIILTKGKGKKNIPSKKEFSEWLVKDHKSRYPEADWNINGEAYPRSPNGSYKNPRVNIFVKTNKLLN